MFKNHKKSKEQESILYNKILLLSRNKSFYTKFALNDTFQNRINLIFLHISFLFIKFKKNRNNDSYKEFNQKMFDYIFLQIDQNMRELGYGDVTVNKNMKYLTKIFYDILIKCENYKLLSVKNKNSFLANYLEVNRDVKSNDNIALANYFDKYEAFCFDLTSDSVLSGELNFIYE